MNQFDGNVGGTVTLAAEQEQVSVVPSHHLHEQSCLLSSQERLQASNTNNGATGTTTKANVLLFGLETPLFI